MSFYGVFFQCIIINNNAKLEINVNQVKYLQLFLNLYTSSLASISFFYIVWSENSLIRSETTQISYSARCSLKVLSKITIKSLLHHKPTVCDLEKVEKVLVATVVY